MTTTTPADIYQAITAAEPPDLDERVLAVIRRHAHKDRITRRALIEAVFGIKIPAGANLSNLTEDRQIRRAIVRLRQDHPILASSGEGGYWYGTPAEVAEFAAEIDSRAMELLKESYRLRRMALELASDVKQMGLPL